MYGENVDALLGEPVSPGCPIQYMSDHQFVEFVDLLFDAYTNGSA